MLLAVLVLGYAGGYMFGVLGVTIGVTVGLILASLVVFLAAKEFELSDGRLDDIGLSCGLGLPLVVAAISTFVGIGIESSGSLAVTSSSLIGCLLAGLCAFLVLPLSVELRSHLKVTSI
jgi:hypothetical protein